MTMIKSIKTAFWLLTITAFVGCNTEELENKILDLEKQNVELQGGSEDKAAVITEFIASMNEIESNLAEIKEREDVISINFDRGSGEINATKKDEIIGDIQLINNLLIQNKEKMAALQISMKNSTVKVAELEKMIARLADQIQEKDAEIVSLQTELSSVNAQLRVLFEEYNLRVEELGEQTQVIAKTKDELNKAYYCYGTFKELKEQGVVSKSGGIIGIGSTKQLSDNFNKEYFTEIDARKITEIELLVKKAKVITNHPTESYQIVGDEKADMLKIIDAKDFWASSKYLVIIVE